MAKMSEEFENHRIEKLLNNFCRACWGTRNLKKSIDLFKNGDMECRIIKFCCSSVEHTSTPDIPLCEFCARKIGDFKNFYTSCINTDWIFRQKLAKIGVKLTELTDFTNDTKIVSIKQEAIDNEFQNKIKEKKIVTNCEPQLHTFTNNAIIKENNASNEDKTKNNSSKVLLVEYDPLELDSPANEKKEKEHLLNTQCDICELILDSSKELLEHKKEYNHYMANNTIRIDGKSCRYKIFKCLYCEKSHFTTKSSFQHHLRVHTGEKRRVCEVCGKPFNYLSDLKRHSFQHTGKKPYQCAICSKGFVQKGYLRFHMMKNHYGERAECDICGVKVSPFGLSAHKSRIHLLNNSANIDKTIQKSSFKPCVCEYCGEKFSTIYTLKVHLQKYHGIGQKNTYKCQYCDKEYNSYNGRAYHIIKFHPSQKTFVSTKPYTCEVCEKTFKLRASLRQHMIRHNGDTRHQCVQCGFICLSKRNLKLHLIGHSGVKNFPCEICNKRFVNKSNLNGHMLTHSMEKNCQCEFCAKSFYTKSALRKHIKINHRLFTNDSNSLLTL